MTDLPELTESDVDNVVSARKTVGRLLHAADDVENFDEDRLLLLDSMLENVQQAVSMIVAHENKGDYESG